MSQMENSTPLHHIISTMCAALGRKAPALSLPERPVRFAVGLIEDVARVIGHPTPISRATIEQYTEDMAVDSRRIREELGFKAKYNLEAGWMDTVEEMRRPESFESLPADRGVENVTNLFSL